MTRCRTIAIAAALLGLTTLPASAAPPGAFVTHLMGRVPGAGKTFACFSRTYDDAHLARRPNQNVRSMRALVVAYSNHDFDYQLRMGFEFRGRPETLTTVAECGNAGGPGDSLRGGARCAGPGDAGSRLRLGGGRSVLITVAGPIHLWKPGPPNPKDTVNDAFGPDDRTFRLDRTALSGCTDQALDDQEKALLERGR